MNKILIDEATVKRGLEALESLVFNKPFNHRYGDVITALREALAKLAEQPASVKQKPVAYGMWDTMLGKDNRMMMVRLDKGQDGCTVPLYTTPQAPKEKNNA